MLLPTSLMMFYQDDFRRKLCLGYRTRPRMCVGVQVAGFIFFPKTVLGFPLLLDTHRPPPALQRHRPTSSCRMEHPVVATAVMVADDDEADAVAPVLRHFCDTDEWGSSPSSPVPADNGESMTGRENGVPVMSALSTAAGADAEAGDNDGDDEQDDDSLFEIAFNVSPEMDAALTSRGSSNFNNGSATVAKKKRAHRARHPPPTPNATKKLRLDAAHGATVARPQSRPASSQLPQVAARDVTSAAGGAAVADHRISSEEEEQKEQQQQDECDDQYSEARRQQPSASRSSSTENLHKLRESLVSVHQALTDSNRRMIRLLEGGGSGGHPVVAATSAAAALDSSVVGVNQDTDGPLAGSSSNSYGTPRRKAESRHRDETDNAPTRATTPRTGSQTRTAQDYRAILAKLRAGCETTAASTSAPPVTQAQSCSQTGNNGVSIESPTPATSGGDISEIYGSLSCWRWPQPAGLSRTGSGTSGARQASNTGSRLPERRRYAHNGFQLRPLPRLDVDESNDVDEAVATNRNESDEPEVVVMPSWLTARRGSSPLVDRPRDVAALSQRPTSRVRAYSPDLCNDLFSEPADGPGAFAANRRPASIATNAGASAEASPNTRKPYRSLQLIISSSSDEDDSDRRLSEPPSPYAPLPESINSSHATTEPQPTTRTTRLHRRGRPGCRVALARRPPDVSTDTDLYSTDAEADQSANNTFDTLPWSSPPVHSPAHSFETGPWRPTSVPSPGRGTSGRSARSSRALRDPPATAVGLHHLRGHSDVEDDEEVVPRSWSGATTRHDHHLLSDDDDSDAQPEMGRKLPTRASIRQGTNTRPRLRRLAEHSARNSPVQRINFSFDLTLSPARQATSSSAPAQHVLSSQRSLHDNSASRNNNNVADNSSANNSENYLTRLRLILESDEDDDGIDQSAHHYEPILPGASALAAGKSSASASGGGVVQHRGSPPHLGGGYGSNSGRRWRHRGASTAASSTADVVPPSAATWSSFRPSNGVGSGSPRATWRRNSAAPSILVANARPQSQHQPERRFRFHDLHEEFEPPIGERRDPVTPPRRSAAKITRGSRLSRAFTSPTVATLDRAQPRHRNSVLFGLDTTSSDEEVLAHLSDWDWVHRPVAKSPLPGVSAVAPGRRLRSPTVALPRGGRWQPTTTTTTTNSHQSPPPIPPQQDFSPHTDRVRSILSRYWVSDDEELDPEVDNDSHPPIRLEVDNDSHPPIRLRPEQRTRPGVPPRYTPSTPAVASGSRPTATASSSGVGAPSTSSTAANNDRWLRMDLDSESSDEREFNLRDTQAAVRLRSFSDPRGRNDSEGAGGGSQQRRRDYSPDPVLRVQQMEADEEFARELQAQFDLEMRGAESGVSSSAVVRSLSPPPPPLPQVARSYTRSRVPRSRDAYYPRTANAIQSYRNAMAAARARTSGGEVAPPIATGLQRPFAGSVGHLLRFLTGDLEEEVVRNRREQNYQQPRPARPVRPSTTAAQEEFGGEVFDTGLSLYQRVAQARPVPGVRRRASRLLPFSSDSDTDGVAALALSEEEIHAGAAAANRARRTVQGGGLGVRRRSPRGLRTRNRLERPPTAAYNDRYEELMAFVDTLDTPSRGLSRNQISSLPVRQWNSATCSGTGTTGGGGGGSPRASGSSPDVPECNICMSEYESGQLLRILPCRHEFHTQCIDQWLKEKNTCPVCRFQI